MSNPAAPAPSAVPAAPAPAETQADTPPAAPTEAKPAIPDDVLENLTPEQVQKVAKKLKIKVKDGDIEEEIEGLDNIQRLVQLRKASDRRFNDAHKKEQALADKEAKIQRIVGALSAKDERALAAIGVDPVDFAEQILRRHVEMAKMSPEARRAMQLEQERDAYRQQIEEHKRREAEAAMAQATEQAYEEMSTQIETALRDAGTSLKMTPYIASRVARTMLYYRDAKKVELSAADAVRMTLPQIEAERRELEDMHFKTMTPEQYEKAYPEKAEEYRKYLLGKASSGFPQAKPPAQSPAAPRQGEQPRRRRGSLDAFLRDAVNFE